ncbi:hypothetical protein AGMMS49543_21570 [Betaproteobacteria bacterium]|nr:hypothetical protein AGMMS49543_21570 [Betaproteobacteria bacterium]GHU16357.1 hypothetical protein AGMMS50243_02230 [Betaproteobacteria bacterium]
MTNFSLLGSVGANGQNFQNDVKNVQTELKKLGFYSGAINGHCDMFTTHAIRTYQSNFMFAPDGVIRMDSETWRYLSDPFRKFPLGAYDPCAVVLRPVEKVEKAPATTITEAALNEYLGKNIKDICKVGYTSNALNHCAHFVSHVLGLDFGETCTKQIHSTEQGANIRVQELFAQCTKVGKWVDIDESVSFGLVFITNGAGVNLNQKSMNNVPKKHVGIFCGSLRRIWHYSNTGDKVVSQTPVEFGRHYPSPHNTMFWGTLPHRSTT